MENQIKTITGILEELLEKMTVDGKVEFISDNNDAVFSIRTKEAGILIGEDGKHLIALNHLVKKMAENKLKSENMGKITFLLDVNDYQIKKMEELRNSARMNAQRAIFFKRDIEMEPMSSYERRVVHAILSEYPDVKTESSGEEPHRRVVIKPLA